MCAKLVFVLSVYLHLMSVCVSDGARILGVFPMAAPSHYILGSALMKGLAEAGHDVTMVSPFPVKNLPKNGSWRDIVLDGVLEDMKKMFDEIDMFKRMDMHPISMVLFMNFMGTSLTEQTLRHNKLQNLINSGEKFDVVIIPQFICDGLKALANHFNGHLIVFSNTAANSWINPLVGNPTLPSFHSEFALGLPKRMNFFQRLYNTFFYLLTTLNFHIVFYPKQNELIQKYIPNGKSIYDVNYNASLVLLNSHTSIFDAQPSTPCMVEIGGFHISPPQQLPEDLQKYLDGAKEGVIYFSMGSNLKSSNLPAEKRDALLKAFSKRKQKILWKWEDDVLPGQPSNVKLSKWFPQQEILAHPNVKAFITHGGLLSTTESVYHGVPVISIPIYGDQKMNAHRSQQGGYGIVLPFNELTEQKLTLLLDEITINPKYRNNIKERSRVMKDRQVSPLQTAVYWVEYVIRHKGAKHLKVAYLNLAWYQLYLLDVIAFVVVVLILSLVLLKKMCSYLCGRRTSKSNPKTTTIKKTN